MGADRSGRKRFYLYPSETSLGWRMIRMVSLIQGEARVLDRAWRRVIEFGSGEHIGYQICSWEMSRGDYEIPSTFSPAAISAEEMNLNAGTKFEEGKSHTRGLSEDRRRLRLVPEDHIERVQQKIRVWPLVGSKVGDVLLAWPL